MLIVEASSCFRLVVCGVWGLVEWEVRSSDTGCGVTAGLHRLPPLFMILTQREKPGVQLQDPSSEEIEVGYGSRIFRRL